MRVVVIESIGTDFESEVHGEGCRDLVKKLPKVDRVFSAANLAEAKEIYEGDNEQFEAEGGPGNGYYFDEMVKVYDCAKERVRA